MDDSVVYFLRALLSARLCPQFPRFKKIASPLVPSKPVLTLAHMRTLSHGLLFLTKGTIAIEPSLSARLIMTTNKLTAFRLTTSTASFSSRNGTGPYPKKLHIAASLIEDL